MTRVLMAFLFLSAALSAQTVATFTVDRSSHRGDLTKAEKLTDGEKVLLAELREKAKQAEDTLAMAEHNVRILHGDRQCPEARYLVMCTGGTDVVLDGDFALIYNWTRTPDYGITW